MIGRLSVIIPTYKRDDSLERLLDCLMLQQNIVLEIIVVDQNAPGFFKPALLSKLSGVIHIQQDKPNASLARNNGFKKSSAPFILFLDDDLIPDETFCRKGLSIFEEHPMIKCFVPLVYSSNGKDLAYSQAKMKRIAGDIKNRTVFRVTDEISAAVFFEKEYFKLTGGFDPCLFDFAKTSEDMEFFLRMQKQNMSVWFVASVEIYHDEGVEGGCELRYSDYWVSRQKNMRAMAFIYRVHNKSIGRLSIIDLIKLLRFSFINKRAFKSGVGHVLKEIKLLNSSIKDSNRFFLNNQTIYFNSLVNFLGNKYGTSHNL